jgi:hypothetical protein
VVGDLGRFAEPIGAGGLVLVLVFLPEVMDHVIDEIGMREQRKRL